MLGTAVIVFREALEAALIIGIVLAATVGLPGRGRMLAVGLGLGLAGAAGVAYFAERIAELAQGLGAELFNAGVLFAAVAMLGWHNVWMSRHGRELSARMNAVGSAVHAGQRPLTALILAVALAVLREGAEVVLFLHGIAASTGTGGMLAGGLLGLGAGALVGGLLYAGLLRIPLRHLFSVTAGLILLLAAGLASQAAALLASVDVLPMLVPRLWDSSTLLAQDSQLGRLLHILIGYDERPMGIQLAFWLATLGLIGAGMRLLGRAASNPEG